MSFCPFCGKELAEGETCTCRQEAQPQQTSTYAGSVNMESEMRGLGDFVKKTFTNPIEAAEEYFEKGTVATTAILWGTLLILSVIVSLLAKVWYVRDYIDYVSGSVFVKAIFFPIIYMVVMTLATVITAFVVDIVLKREFRLDKLISLCGAVMVPLIVGMLATWLRVYMPVSGLSLVFSMIITLSNFVALIQGLACLNKMIPDRKKLLLGIVISIVMLMLFRFLICLPLGSYTGFVPLTF